MYLAGAKTIMFLTKYCGCPAYVGHPQSRKCRCLDNQTSTASRALESEVGKEILCEMS